MFKNRIPICRFITICPYFPDPLLAADVDDPIPLEDFDIELRGYQEELAREGCSGKNAIVIAPTNSGKTRVACRIIQV